MPVHRLAVERVVDRHDDGVARARLGDLLEGHDVRHRAGAAPAPLLGNHHAHEAELPHALDRLVREARFPIDLGGDRPDLGVGELPDRRLNQLLLLGQIKLHFWERGAPGARDAYTLRPPLDSLLEKGAPAVRQAYSLRPPLDSPQFVVTLSTPFWRRGLRLYGRRKAPAPLSPPPFARHAVPHSRGEDRKAHDHTPPPVQARVVASVCKKKAPIACRRLRAE